MLICGFDGTDLPTEFAQLLERQHLGGIILFARNFVDLEQLKSLTSRIHGISPSPIFIAVDQEGGRVVRFSGDFPVFPSPAHYGSSDDYDGLRIATRTTAEALKSAGVNLNLLPVCDLAPSDQSHVIYSRSYSSSSERLVAAVKSQIAEQRQAGIYSCAKHFPGLQSAHGDPHLMVSRSNQSLQDFRNSDYLPFKAAIDAHAEMVMVTHLFAPSIDPDNIVTFSARAIEQELRGYLKFNGLIITDDLLMAGSLEGISAAEAGIRAIRAGCNLLVYGDVTDQVDSILGEIVRTSEVDHGVREQIQRSSVRLSSFKSDTKSLSSHA